MRACRRPYGLVLGLALSFIAGPARSEEVVAAVAANFTPAIQRMAPEFERATGHKLVATFGATGQLYAQVKNGAPFDVFLSADDETPEKLESEGLGVSGTRFTYAVGELVLWSPKAGTVDGKGEVLKKGDFKHLAIANPKVAPYGAAAVEVMKHLGVWERLEPRLVQGESITQAFQFVVSGSAELGFVALSQVRALPEDKRGSEWAVPSKLHAPLKQDAVLLKHGAEKPGGRAFLDYLRSPPGRAIIEELGYSITP